MTPSRKEEVPKSHPRHRSLEIRNLIVEGVDLGITSPHGLIAHGRGEAFDYLIGERTNIFADRAIRVAAAKLLLARHPVISVNGNAAALAAPDLVALSKCLSAPLEVNIFHTSSEREKRIAHHLFESGAESVLLPTTEFSLDFIDSNRRFVNPDGIYRSDLVFVPLEDGDRCEALVKMGKEVITVDLNPLSRTAKTATLTIVDNMVRAVPELVARIVEFKNISKEDLGTSISEFNNQEMLARAEATIRAINHYSEE